MEETKRVTAVESALMRLDKGLNDLEAAFAELGPLLMPYSRQLPPGCDSVGSHPKGAKDANPGECAQSDRINAIAARVEEYGRRVRTQAAAFEG